MIKVTKEQFEILKPRCNCPCNQLIPWKEHYKWYGVPKYIHGHNPHISHPLTKNQKEKLSKTKWNRTGCIPWNKGRHDVCLEKDNPFYGKHHTEETKNKTRKTWQTKFENGYVQPLKGKKMSSSFSDKCRLRQTGTHQSKDTINKRIKKGACHYNWKGGISYLPYCNKFNNELKEAVRERDGRLCQLCNKTEDKNGSLQTVHHIHYLKEECEPDLITLCKSCNCKVNYNRGYYEELFMNILNRRELLFWTRDYFKKQNNIYSLNTI